VLSTAVLGGCHALAFVDGELVGDQMERAALRAAGWSWAAGAPRCAARGGRRELRSARG
jgi:hypothetical protein